MNLKAQLKKVLVPEISLVTLFVVAGYSSGNIRLEPVHDVSWLILLVIGCYFFGAEILKSYLRTPKSDLKLHHKILAIVSMLLIIIPPFISYGQGWNAFMVTCIMFCFLVGFSIPHHWVTKKINQIAGLDILLQSLTWGCLPIAMGALFSGLEPDTRSWLIVLLGFYIFASYFIMVEMNGAKALHEKPSLIMYLGESRSLELIAILQLFGIIGLTTLYLSEYDSLNMTNLSFYALFTLIAFIGVFQTLVWSKKPTERKRFNYLFFLIANNLYLFCWVVAEWFYY